MSRARRVSDASDPCHGSDTRAALGPLTTKAVPPHRTGGDTGGEANEEMQ